MKDMPTKAPTPADCRKMVDQMNREMAKPMPMKQIPMKKGG